MTGSNLPEDIAQWQRSPISVNETTAVATYQGLFSFQPDRPLTAQQQFTPYNVWYQQNGGLASRGDNRLYHLQTDGAQEDSEAALETSQLGIYRPGALVTASTGCWFDVEPTGDAYYDVGYTDTTTTEGIHHRIGAGYENRFRIASERYENGEIFVESDMMEAGNVTRIEDGGEMVGEVYGLDGLRNLGPGRENGVDGTGDVLGITVGWYGPTSVMGYYIDVGDWNGQWVQRPWPLFMYRPRNGPAFRRPNQPLSARANNGTSGQDLRMRVGGRQFATRGEVPVSPEPTFHYADQQTLPMDGSGSTDRDWYVVAAIRRKPSGTGTGLGLAYLKLVSNAEPIAFMTRVGEVADISGTLEWDEPVDTEADQTAIEVDCATDTPERLTWGEETKDGTVKAAGGSWSGNIAGATGTGGQQKPTSGEASVEETLGFPFVREHPTVVLATTRSGSTDEVTTAFEVQEVG